MSYFITKANFLRVMERIELTPDQLLKPVYKLPIYILSKREIKKILSVKHVLSDIQNNVVALTKATEQHDTYTYVNEYTHFPKYHVDKNCIALTSNFQDIIIPDKIRIKDGKLNTDEIQRFRDWMKRTDIRDLMENNPKSFQIQMEIKFGVNQLKDENIVNKGYQGVSSQTVQELEQVIEDLIKYSLDYCYIDDKRAKILMGSDLRLYTYLATSPFHKDLEIPLNNTGYSDSEVRLVLLGYYNSVKIPLFNALIDYYILSLNEGLHFNRNVMEALEFKPCRKCVKES